MNLQTLVQRGALILIAIPLGCTSSSSSRDDARYRGVTWQDCVKAVPEYSEKPTVPFPRVNSYDWMSRDEWCWRFRAMLKDPARSGARLALMGDSITQMWPKMEWATYFSTQKALRLGIGGDKTQNLLWRIQNGELSGLSLHTLVLLIGTNNLAAGDSPEDVRDGIKLVMDEIRKSQPGIRIVLMAIFPRGQDADDEWRGKILATNRLLATDSETWRVDWIDIGPRLLEKDGSISQDTMGDFVHLTPKAYRIWGDALVARLP